MPDAGPSRPLFAEFPPVSTEEWDALIRTELDEFDQDAMLTWRPLDALSVRPFYRSEDMRELRHLGIADARDSVPLSSAWSIQQNILVGQPDDVARRLSEAAEGGVDILGLEWSESRRTGGSAGALELLAESVDRADTGIHLDAGLSSLAYLDALLEQVSGREAPLRSVSASYDPISELARTGRYRSDWPEEALRCAERLPRGARILQAGAGIFHEAGADLIDETAFILASVSEYVARLIEGGMPAAQIPGLLYVSVQVGSSYFLEIARLRALRLLLQQVMRAFEENFGANGMGVHACVSRRNMTRYDAHSNLLRATTEASSAVIGGCDVLVVRPFDGAEHDPSDFAYRLARNIQHLLRYEAFLDPVDDPSAGSYYVEVLTDLIGRSAWGRFQEIERQGGFVRAFEKRLVHDAVGAARHRLMRQVARQESVLVGTNRYPDPNERMARARDEAQPPNAGGVAPEIERRQDGVFGPPLERRRAAEAVEAMRLRTDNHAERTGRRLTVGLLSWGDSPERRTRMHHAVDFLRCGGIEVHGEHHVPSSDETIAAAGQVRADALLLVGPNAWHSDDVVHDIRSLNQFAAIGVAAEPSLVDGADFLVYPGADLVETLSKLQNLLGLDP